MSKKLATGWISYSQLNENALRMKHLFDKIKASRQNLAWVTFAAALLLLFFAMPWYELFPSIGEMIIIGLPFSYVISLLVVPVVGVLLLILHNRQAEDIDRHTLEFENE